MKKILFSILGFLILFSLSSQDFNLSDEIIRINQIESEEEKIAELDKIAVILEQGKSTEFISKWNINKMDDEMNNRTIYFITVTDENDDECNLTIQYVKSLRPSKDSVSIFLDTKMFFYNKEHEVTYKYDGTYDSFDETWGYTGDNKNLIIDFPDKMLKEFAIYDEINISLITKTNTKEKSMRTFEIYGFQQALAQYDIDLDRLIELAE